jgi:hypothetical protein
MTAVDAEAARIGAFEAFYRDRRAEAVRLAWLLTHDATAAGTYQPR